MPQIDYFFCRFCDAIQTLKTAAQGIIGSARYHNLRDELQTALGTLSTTINKANQVKDKFNKQRAIAELHITSFHDEVREAADSWKSSVLTDLTEKHTQLIEKSNSRQTMLTSQMAEVDEIFTRIRDFNGENECELFYLVTMSQQLLNDLKTVVQDAKVDHTNLKVKMIPNVEDIVGKVKHMGYIVENKDTGSNIITFSTRKDCHVSDICQLWDGTLMLTDYKNKVIKRIGKNIQDLRLNGHPKGVCEIEPGQIAVTMQTQSSKKVMIASLGDDSICIQTQFSVIDEVFGLTCCEGLLYICQCSFGLLSTRSYIKVYNTMGNQVRKIELGPNKEPLFSSAFNVIHDVHGKLLYVTDSSRGLVILDIYGTPKSTIHSAEGFRKATCLCKTQNGDILVAGSDSNTIGRLTATGVKPVLSEKDGILKPKAVCYDVIKGKLLVANSGSNFINVYEI